MRSFASTSCPAVYSPVACIQLTLKTAREQAFPLDRLIFEITEAEKVQDRQHVLHIMEEYHRHGFQVALDDFGAGYSGLNLFAELTPDILKLDMDLTRNVHLRPIALAIVRSLVQLCSSFNVALVAEGVETIEEYATLRASGIKLMQGYLFAKPAFEELPSFSIPGDNQILASVSAIPSSAAAFVILSKSEMAA